MSDGERLNTLDLLPLCLRRDFLDIVFLYNYINDLIDVDLESVVSFVNMDRRTRNNLDYLSLKVNYCKLESYRSFFVNRIAHSWNRLPLLIRETELTDLGQNTSFKRLVKDWLKTHCMPRFDSDNTCTWLLKCTCRSCVLV